MDYSIQQLTLIHPSIHSSVDYKAGGTQEQPVIKVLNSEHLTSKEGVPSLTVRDVLQDATDNGRCRCDGYSLKTFHNDPSDFYNSIHLLSGCVDQRGYPNGRD
ncbi:MAG TPA: hypothetical protein VFQ13_20920 [Anaerolineales bacterium]|nr:hypothetical protein [Anaerolineales bacterium]